MDVDRLSRLALVGVEEEPERKTVSIGGLYWGFGLSLVI
jgi:hypothetical protein